MAGSGNRCSIFAIRCNQSHRKKTVFKDKGKIKDNETKKSGFWGTVFKVELADMHLRLIQYYPGLEIAAFAIVGWVGVKLAVLTLSHPDVGVISYEFAHSVQWKIIFYTVLIGIAVAGWFLFKDKNTDASI